MYDVRVPYELCCCRVFSSGAVVSAEVWEQSMSRECTSRGESEHVWGERCKVNSGSFDTALCHEEWVGQEKEWNCREGCSSLGPRLNWQVKALSSWWGCWVFSDSSPIHVKSLWIFNLPCSIPTSVFCFVRHTFFLLWKNVLGTPMMYKAVRGLVRPHLSAGSF